MRDHFDRAVPCQWCGNVPTGPCVVTPAEVVNFRVVRCTRYADACRSCAKRLRLGEAGRRNVNESTSIRRQLDAEARARRRAALRAAQGELFDPTNQPTNALLGG